jgi:integrase
VLTLTVEKAKKTSIYFKQEKTGNEGMIENPCLSEILLYLRYLNLEDHDFLFATSIYRKPLSKVQAWSIISRAGAMVLQKKLSPHSFRAYAVTHLKKLGYTNKEIKGITLHSSESMVEYYDLGKSTIENTKDLLL